MWISHEKLLQLSFKKTSRMVSGVSVWWQCKWRKWHIIFCLGMLPKQQRNVMRVVGVSSLNLLWEDLTKAQITLPPCLCCHPEEKWACRKSPWQLCVLKRQTACSQFHFIACYFTPCCREKKSCSFKCWCVCLEWWIKAGMNGQTCTERGPRVHWETSIQPLFRIWTSRNSTNSFSMESGGFITFFEDVNLNV